MIPIVTYGPNADAPPAMRYAAAMVPDHRPGSHWQATGPTPEAARAKLETLWRKVYPEKRAELDDLV